MCVTGLEKQEVKIILGVITNSFCPSLHFNRIFLLPTDHAQKPAFELKLVTDSQPQKQ